MAYQPSIPTGTIPLNQDYLNIQGNFTALNNTFSIDHSPLTGTLPPGGTAGYHTQVHLVPQATPAADVGYGQIYSTTVNDGINNDQTLFFLTGGNRNLKLTRNFVPTVASAGMTFLPGGLIMQWGSVSAGNATTPVSFISGFTSVYSVTTGAGSSGSNAQSSVDVSSVLPTGFNLRSTTAGGGAQTHYWMAIGV